MTDATQRFDPVQAQAEESAAMLRMLEETRKFINEQHKLMAEASKLNAETNKLTAEADKLAAERAKLARDRELAPWQIAFGGMAAGPVMRCLPGPGQMPAIRARRVQPRA